MRRLAILWIFGLFCTPAVGWGASTVEAPHIKMQLVAENQTVRPGDAFWVGLRFDVEKHWHIYWQNPGDSGQPVSVRWALPAGVTAEPLQWPLPTRFDMPPLTNYGYADRVTFPVPMHADGSLKTGDSISLAGEVRWLVCAEICIPGKATVDVRIPVAAATVVDPAVAGEFNGARAALPQLAPPTWHITGISGEHPMLRVESGVLAQKAEFFPFQGEQIEHAAPEVLHATPKGFELTLHKDEQAHSLTRLSGLLVVTDAQGRHGYTVDLPLEAPPVSNVPPLWSVLLLALAGGLVLNLMPCVFPVLSLKVMSFLHASHHDKRTARVHAALYTAGILVSFWLLTGALLTLRFGGQQIGWGFQLQSPAFVVFVASLLFLLGLNLLGIFEIGGAWMGAGQGLASRGGHAGAFFTGVLAVIVATPCTAPFMGTAVGFALSQSAPVAFAVFTALALGLALPYVVLSFVPNLGKVLPRPGPWMVTLREFMAFLLFGTVVWLTWVLGMEAGLSAVTFLLVDFLLLGCAAWALHRWPGKRPSFAGAMALSCLALGVGMWQASDGVPCAQAGEHGSAAASDLPWEPYSADTLARYRASGRPIFVDFTAAWCLSCKVNESLVFGSAEVRDRVRALNMVLLKGDWTHQDPAITRALAAFGRSGVPLYVVYPKDANAAPIQLPEVITAGIVLDALAKLQ